MSAQLNPSDPNDKARKIADFGLELFTFLETLSKAEENLDGLFYDFCELIKTLGFDPAAMKKPIKHGLKLEPSSEQEQGLKSQAAAGVSSIKWIPQPNGSTLVHLDGGVGVPLTPRLAALLDVLAADTGHSPDHLVAWKALPEILDGLKVRTGKVFTNRAVRQLIYRLRNQFKLHLTNHFYVVSSREGGYRFALRRGVGAVTPDNHK
jgi:hypothetical protein